MARTVEATIRVADLDQFREFVSAAGGVIRAYDAVRDGTAGTALGMSIDGLRSAMAALVPAERK
jgi:hypothetical protein